MNMKMNIHTDIPLPSLNFNIVCKRLGAHRMSYFLNEAATEMRDLLMPDLAAQAEKAKL
jgi:carnitine O-acetyltransferase